MVVVVVAPNTVVVVVRVVLVVVGLVVVVACSQVSWSARLSSQFSHCAQQRSYSLCPLPSPVHALSMLSQA